MHETGLCEAIVEATVRRARGRRVIAVRVRVGGHPVDPDVIDQGFRLASTGTVAEDASLEAIASPLIVHCRGCGARTDATDALSFVACPACGGVDVEAAGGDEIVLESITVETSDGTGPGGTYDQLQDRLGRRPQP